MAVAGKDSLTLLGGTLQSRMRGAKVSPLAVATFVFVAAIMGVFGWLSLAGDPLGGEPQVVMALPPDFVGSADSAPEQLIDMAEAEEAQAPRPQAKPEDIEENETKTSPWSAPSDLAQLRDNPLSQSPAESAAISPGDVENAETFLDPALLAEGPNGSLPIIAQDGRRALDVYARPFTAELSRPRIGILIRGLGLSAATTENAIENLPPEITLSFVPYAKNLQSWVDKARRAGHEVMLELPMEPYDYPNNDSGPFTLLTSLQDEEVSRRLDWLLSRFGGYVGVTNYLGAKFTSSRKSMAPVLDALAARGLLYVDDGLSGGGLVPELAAQSGLVFAVGDRNLNYASGASIDSDLLGLENDARRNGAALATGFAFPVTIQHVSDWAAALESKGFSLAPISALTTTPPQS